LSANKQIKFFKHQKNEIFMNIKIQHIIIVILLLTKTGYAQQSPRAQTDANIFGHVLDAETGEHLPFVTIGIKGTTVGTVTDQTGHYRIINAPAGIYTLQASFTGYKTGEIQVTNEEGRTTEVDFELEPDMLRLDEVVISAGRYAQRRSETSVITSSLTPKLLATVQALVLSEGLNFTPGLRMETNCSNCGFNQIRINGLEGPYSQILINGRPIFSGLAAVYGLELIPANMIDRVEVIRGGSSVLYGSNAIAGTINLRLKEPLRNTYEAGTDYGLIGVGHSGSGAIAGDRSMNANVSVVSDDGKSGISIFGFSRTRDAFDANNDDFTELVQLNNSTFGSRIYQRLSIRSKVTVDFFRINENRRGGNRLTYPEHESDIAESLSHRITAAGLTYEQFLRESDVLSVFASAQNVERDSYYGANRALNGYGHTEDLTINAGVGYKAESVYSTIIFGADVTHGSLNDKKLGYPDLENTAIMPDSSLHIPYEDNVTTARQRITTGGLFAQYEFKINQWRLNVGARFDHYNIDDGVDPNADKSGSVFVPKASLLYNLNPYLQGRMSYSRGYRTPQIFDEDLHIEASGLRKVIHQNAPDLKQENSNSVMASLDYNRLFGRTGFGILVEGFYTRLENPFALEFGPPDEDGTVIYTRSNSDEAAFVQGLNIEFNMSPQQKLNLSAGFTIQSSRFEEEQDFDEKRFFRTPNSYGFFTAETQFGRSWSFSANGNYTGKMLIPYFGPALDDPEAGELRESKAFFDAGLKINYTIKFNVSQMSLYAGIKNIFNSYQSDFDYGIERDPGYVYGPAAPRTIYVGLKFGNLLF
jgi:outer membrane receptor for ferrienterochelin and colicins